MDAQTAVVAASYDRVAAQYGRRIGGELAHKPLDRFLLDRFASMVGTRGQVCDAGCGPGHVAAYLRERGAEVVGVDVSTGMVNEARQRFPGIDFQHGDLKSLPFAESSLGGIVAMYAIIHVARAEMPATLTTFRKLLCPGGALLLAFHVGDDDLHVNELWGTPVSLDFAFLRRADVERWVVGAGLAIDESLERSPYPGVEYQSTRGYILAHRPSETE